VAVFVVVGRFVLGVAHSQFYVRLVFVLCFAAL